MRYRVDLTDSHGSGLAWRRSARNPATGFPMHRAPRDVRAYMSGEQSIDQAAERSQRLPSERIARLDFQRFLEAAHGVAVHFFPEVRASQIVMWKMAGLVAARFRGTLEPGNRVVKAILFDQIGPDVVVGVAKIGIDLDGALAFG